MPNATFTEQKAVSAAVRYVIDCLRALDRGDDAPFTCSTAKEVSEFCKLLGFKATWARKTVESICIKSKFGPDVIREDEAAKLLAILKSEFKRGTFKAKEKEAAYSPSVINDFLPVRTGKFAGKACLGHLWEFQYALAVELEHGRTRGTNVTNNHPLLTALVVLAHLSEDSLYYARLWVMETEGELYKATLEDAAPKKVKEIAQELQVARLYLGRRLAEYAGRKLELPA